MSRLGLIAKELRSYPYFQSFIGTDLASYATPSIPVSQRKLCTDLNALQDSWSAYISSKKPYDVGLAQQTMKETEKIIEERMGVLRKLEDLKGHAEYGFQSLLKGRVNVTENYVIKYEYKRHPVELIGMLENLLAEEESVEALESFKQELEQRIGFVKGLEAGYVQRMTLQRNASTI